MTVAKYAIGSTPHKYSNKVFPIKGDVNKPMNPEQTIADVTNLAHQSFELYLITDSHFGRDQSITLVPHVYDQIGGT